MGAWRGLSVKVAGILGKGIAAGVVLAAPSAWAANTPPAGVRTAPPAAASPSPALPSGLMGTWSGKVSQLGRDSGYTLVVSITTGGALSEYPDSGCAGRLTRAGSSGSYVFYSEQIIKNRYDAGTAVGCIDGTMTMSRQGEKLLVVWFGAFQGDGIVATAVLTPSGALR